MSGGIVNFEEENRKVTMKEQGGRGARLVNAASHLIIIVIIFILTGTFKVFDFVIGLTGGGPAYATEVPITLLYKQAFTYGKFGYANAISVMMVLLCLLIALLVNHIFAEHELPGRRKHLP